MIHTPLSTTSVLDETADVVTATATPWAGLLILTALPYRFLQALFLDQLFEVGDAATSYGNLLGATANMTVAAIVLALWGRAVYARACRLTLPGQSTAGKLRGNVLRVPFPALLSYFLTASLSLLLGWVTIFTVLGYVAAVIFAGIAIGTYELNDRVSLTQPFRQMARYSSRIGIPIALVFVFFCATIVALVNLAAAAYLLTWLVGAIGNFDAPRWQLLFAPGNRRYLLMLLAGALVIVEPFWIAAHVIYVRKAGAEQSGDDLRAWFAELRRAS